MLTTTPESNDLLAASPKECLRSARGERAQAAADHHREDHQPQLVDELVFDQRFDQGGAAGDEDRGSLAGLQLADPVDVLVACDQVRVLPLERLRQGRGDDVLRHRVDLLGELPLALRPGAGEAFVGHPAEQVRLRLERLVEFELGLLGAHVIAHPSRVGMGGLAARRLGHPVEGDELGDHQSGHRLGPSLGTERDVLDVESRQPSLEPVRDPPVAVPEQLHHRRNQDHPDHGGVEEDRDR